ncbi:MAG: hypothetical protein HY063_02405 [Bacteroidetes bacterium]|nr:hypothetical protein [Bacteroidota bacterium]
MRRILFILLFLFTAKTFFAQDSLYYKNNIVYAEGLGNAGYGVYSLNYERKIKETNNGFITLRVGFAYNYNKNLFFPILINKVNNKHKKNHFEFGGGITTTLFKSASLDLAYTGPTANLMYRYQKPNGKFIFRAGWTPVLYLIDSDTLITIYFLLFPGISFGYAF